MGQRHSGFPLRQANAGSLLFASEPQPAVHRSAAMSPCTGDTRRPWRTPGEKLCATESALCQCAGTEPGRVAVILRTGKSCQLAHDLADVPGEGGKVRMVVTRPR
jgi:hypothetical protein